MIDIISLDADFLLIKHDYSSKYIDRDRFIPPNYVSLVYMPINESDHMEYLFSLIMDKILRVTHSKVFSLVALRRTSLDLNKN